MKTPLLRGTLIELSPWHDNPVTPRLAASDGANCGLVSVLSRLPFSRVGPCRQRAGDFPPGGTLFAGQPVLRTRLLHFGVAADGPGIRGPRRQAGCADRTYLQAQAPRAISVNQTLQPPMNMNTKQLEQLAMTPTTAGYRGAIFGPIMRLK